MDGACGSAAPAGRVQLPWESASSGASAPLSSRPSPPHLLCSSFCCSAAGHRQGEDIGWNFEKLLIDKHGHPVKRYSSGAAHGAAVVQYNLEMRQREGAWQHGRLLDCLIAPSTLLTAAVFLLLTPPLLVLPALYCRHCTADMVYHDLEMDVYNELIKN